MKVGRQYGQVTQLVVLIEENGLQLDTKTNLWYTDILMMMMMMMLMIKIKKNVRILYLDCMYKL
jgi:hypothetical protein